MNRAQGMAQVARDLTKGRQLLEAAMLETVTITRTGDTTTDGYFTHTPTEIVATGVPARITMRSLSGYYEVRPFAGGHYVTVYCVKISVPIGPPVKVGDVLEVTASASSGDKVGRRFRVSNTQDHTQTTALRLSGEEVTHGR